jgi:VIT1/CCC1 family predicted Fe2+/Mn2+ transporter
MPDRSTPPAATLPDHHHDHADVTAGGLRAAIFGAMDGLISNAGLVAVVSGGGAEDAAVRLAGLAGLVAGAFSMAAGEWISITSQNEVTERELSLERLELARNPDSERRELAETWVARGLSAELAAQVAEEVSRNPDEALRIHAETELGIDPNRLPSPMRAAGSSLGAFAVGAFIPVAPFLVGGRWSLLIALALVALALFALGVGVARLSRRRPWFGGLRQLVIGATLIAAAYGLGVAFGTAVG